MKQRNAAPVLAGFLTLALAVATAPAYATTQSEAPAVQETPAPSPNTAPLLPAGDGPEAEFPGPAELPAVETELAEPRADPTAAETETTAEPEISGRSEESPRS
ncbi:hypothetical protein FYJ28_10445 [Arthrobacter sp. BL-252-APC-1A]|uniref:hypothetical protein n=1 Tax=Arthrobacter sp. BL-252-APC-1A TaxID=2606622 RepID=UPI0012B2F9E8|nr:hypothetical protein [Arthrobacter sp. BL-252-APC-1A]MSR99239.1 hypothetical protein [Arthrobacter sp. BL-252-APC-1A]